jgi:hypothetical protein
MQSDDWEGKKADLHLYFPFQDGVGVMRIRAIGMPVPIAKWKYRRGRMENLWTVDVNC